MIVINAICLSVIKNILMNVKRELATSNYYPMEEK